MADLRNAWPHGRSVEFCTFCGTPRGLSEPEFSFHQVSLAHKQALRQWDRRRLQQTGSHHDGHKALGIACSCAAQVAA